MNNELKSPAEMDDVTVANWNGLLPLYMYKVSDNIDGYFPPLIFASFSFLASSLAISWALSLSPSLFRAI